MTASYHDEESKQEKRKKKKKNWNEATITEKYDLEDMINEID